MKKPARVPPDALWNPDESLWEHGEMRDGLRVGEWTVLRPDGSYAGIVPYDDQGRRHGTCRRWHANGEIAIEARYRAGVRHGRQMVCRPTDGPNLDENAKVLAQMDPELFRMDSVWVDDELCGTTLYNREGMLAPIEPGSDLVAQLGKLMRATSFVLTRPSLSTVDSAPLAMIAAKLAGEEVGDAAREDVFLPLEVPASMISFITYRRPTGEGETTHELLIADQDWTDHIAYVEADEIGRALALETEEALRGLED